MCSSDLAYAEMSMLRGDPSDGLPGVTGIGEKTAAKLITAFGNLDALEKAALEGDSSVPTRSRNALAAATDYLAAARVVVAVRTDAGGQRKAHGRKIALKIFHRGKFAMDDIQRLL